jgi:hypothetical protein
MPLTVIGSYIYLKIKLPSLKVAFNTQANLVIIGKNDSNVIFIVVTMSWIVCELIVLSLFIGTAFTLDYIGYVSWIKSKYGKCDSMCQAMSLTLNGIMGMSGAISVVGCALAMILLYVLSYHRLALMRRHLYSRLICSSNSFMKPVSLMDLKKLRKDEEELSSIEELINESIGWMPTVWLAETFLRVCVMLSVIVLDRMDLKTGFIYSIDIMILNVILFGSVIYVGIISNEFNMNTIIRLINRGSIHLREILETTDKRFDQEKINYMLEASFRFNNKPKSFGLFTINANLLLSFLNTVIPFTVMIVQLVGTARG